MINFASKKNLPFLAPPGLVRGAKHLWELFLKHFSLVAYSDDHSCNLSVDIMDELLSKATNGAESWIRHFRLNKLFIKASKAEFVVIRPDCKRNYTKESIVIDGHLVEENTL